jgi:hypothetical protein
MNAGDIFYDCNTLKKVAECDGIKNCDFIYGDYIRNVGDELFYCKSRTYSSIWYGMITSHQAMFFENKMLLFISKKFRIKH